MHSSGLSLRDIAVYEKKGSIQGNDTLAPACDQTHPQFWSVYEHECLSKKRVADLLGANKSEVNHVLNGFWIACTKRNWQYDFGSTRESKAAAQEANKAIVEEVSNNTALPEFDEINAGDFPVEQLKWTLRKFASLSCMKMRKGRGWTDDAAHNGGRDVRGAASTAVDGDLTSTNDQFSTYKWSNSSLEARFRNAAGAREVEATPVQAETSPDGEHACEPEHYDLTIVESEVATGDIEEGGEHPMESSVQLDMSVKDQLTESSVQPETRLNDQLREQLKQAELEEAEAELRVARLKSATLKRKLAEAME